MIALAASLLLAVYLVIPGSIFRLFFGFFVPLRNFIRSRAEEIFQGVLSTVLPVFLAAVLVWLVPPFSSHPFGFNDTSQLRRTDYKLLFGATYSDQIYRKNEGQFWKALTRSAHRQGRFIVWYYALIIGEGCVFGGLSVLYPWLSKVRLYKWTAKHVLLPNISEWHLLFTPFYFKDKKTIVRADILCSDGTLYRGKVWEHSLGKDGELKGLILKEAKRYARDDYLREKEKGKVNKDDYWRTIPGSKFYILADRVVNLNLSYETTPEADTRIMEDLISRQLNQNIDLIVEPKPSSLGNANPSESS